eukprot:39197-Eustigmatos_ZCMA.PRE.1
MYVETQQRNIADRGISETSTHRYLRPSVDGRARVTVEGDGYRMSGHGVCAHVPLHRCGRSRSTV